MRRQRGKLQLRPEYDAQQRARVSAHTVRVAQEEPADSRGLVPDYTAVCTVCGCRFEGRYRAGGPYRPRETCGSICTERLKVRSHRRKEESA